MPSSTVPAINYTARSFFPVKEAFLTHLKEKFPDTWRDFYESCFVGETMVSLVDGTECAIESLVNKGSVYIYAYNHDTDRIVCGKAIAKKTRKNACLVEVVLDNGKKIRCTPDHPWMLRDGTYRQALNLKLGDSLMPLYRRVSSKYAGYEQIRQPDTKRWNLTHRCFVDGPVQELVHHKNYNKKDNRPENLEWMTFQRHGELHDLTARWRNFQSRKKLMRDALSPEGRKRRSENLKALNRDSCFREKLNKAIRTPESRKKKSIASRRNWKDPAFKARCSESIRKSWTPERRAKRSQEMKQRCQNSEFRVKVSEGLKRSWTDEKRHCLSERMVISNNKPGIREKLSFESKRRWADPCFKTKMSTIRKELWKDPQRKRCASERMKERNKSPEFRQQISEGVKQYCVANNHKVVSVRVLPEREDTYCLFVEKYGNFALSAGVFVHNSIGIALMDLIGMAFDVLSFQLDYTANELYLDTARDRRSILLLGRLVGYQLRTATSASVKVTATLAQTYPVAVVIPAYTVVTSQSGVKFYTATDQEIVANSISGEIYFTQGERQTNNFTSDGSTFQKFELTRTPVVQDTIEVQVDGDDWTQYTSLAYAVGDTKAFAVEFDENGVGYIMFGDGDNGQIPPTYSAISVVYRTGGGVQGNIPLNNLSTVIQGYQSGVAPVTWVQVTILNNSERGSGGEEAESRTHAKLWIPRWVMTNNRAVTEQDYDTLANAWSDPTYGAPSFAKAQLKQNIPELNTVELAVWGRNSDGSISIASVALKNAIEDYFNNNGIGSVKCICTHTEVIDGEILYVDIDVSASLESTFTETQIRGAILKAINRMFTESEITPGDDFRISFLYRTIQGVTGIYHSIVNSIILSKMMTGLIGFGTGAVATFNHTFDLDPGSYVIGNSIRVWYGDDVEVLTDDGEGNIMDSAEVTVGTIDYDTGLCTFTFTAAPGALVPIYSQARYVIDYQRGGQEATGDGMTVRFRGEIEYPPVNPYDGATGQKGIAFTDGTQDVVDDGNGNLIGDVDSYNGVNRIDYTSGAYDFTFVSAPPNEVGIYSTYRQILKTASQDLPVDKQQLAVRGNVLITIVEAS